MIDLDKASTDPVVETNVALLRSRSALGIEKYGVTLADSKAPLRDWLEHALLEVLDCANYLQTAMHKIDAEPAPATPAASVDTAEFRSLMGEFIAPQGYIWPNMVAHIDAHTARAVAAAYQKGFDTGKEYEALDRTATIEGVISKFKAAAPQKHAQAALSDRLSEVSKAVKDAVYAIIGPGFHQRLAVLDIAGIIRAISHQPAAAPEVMPVHEADQLIELAAALEQEWLAKTIAELRAIEFYDGAFKAGYESALDEIETRCALASPAQPEVKP